MLALTADIRIISPVESLNHLFEAGGMASMLNTILLILCAMFFGGTMEAIGALQTISTALLRLADSIFGLFASTVASCLAVNIVTSDQYLSIVVPGKMFTEVYKIKGLAPENLSRTLEDSSLEHLRSLSYRSIGYTYIILSSLCIFQLFKSVCYFAVCHSKY